MENKSFTGRSRQRKTTRLVRFADILARGLITMGGVGTIIAVSLVCVFLAAVVIPLFGSASLTKVGTPEGVTLDMDGGGQSRHVAVDEYRVMGAAVLSDGQIETFHLDTGKPIVKQPLVVGGPKLTAWAFGANGQSVLGFEDGTVRLASIAFKPSFVGRADLPAEIQSLKPGELATHEGAVYQAMRDGQVRRQSLEVSPQEGVKLASDASIDLIDVTYRPDGPVIAALSSDGTLYIKKASSKKNLMTGKVVTKLSGAELKLDLDAAEGKPKFLLLSGVADTVYVIWESGKLIRLDTREPSSPVVAETLDVTPQPGVKVTACRFLIGKTSLAIGDSVGGVSVWFRIKPESASKIVDGSTLAHAHVMPVAGKPVTALAASARTRKLAAGFADGSVRLYYVTLDRLLCEATTVSGAPIDALAMAPKDDGLLALSGATMHRWDVFAPHPEATFSAIFRPVWYEGYNAPEHTWQSSSGEDAFEPKFGLQRLIFGTIKATFYAMLFGTPLALLAAVYTSEFMHPKVKARVKPAIELMASLPSVVLGFIAALVLAPVAEAIVPELVTSVFTIPATLLLGAYLWQLVPVETSIILSQFGTRSSRPGQPIGPVAQAIGAIGGLRTIALFVALAAGVSLAAVLGRPIEKLLFSGDIKSWLDGQVGSGTGGWMLLLLPVSAVAVAFFVTQAVNPQIRRAASGLNRAQLARLDIAKYVFCVVAILGLAYAAGAVLTALGHDPRGDVLGTYVQRNAMVVGFVMGFAVIPIIYTISEDALSSVPQHLRAASLGAGATPWQTAVRIVVPTAASGLFSAVMIGFGRAIGETMIVLMAAGNSPVKEWNIFSGMRTLSANIAVELPEAVQDSTHYRMLFLAALTLFMMTFLLNTIAEVVRQRFRKRAFQL